MFIMENVWNSIYFQLTLSERPLLPFYQDANLAVNSIKGVKINRMIKGEAVTTVQKVGLRHFQCLTNILLGEYVWICSSKRICVNYILQREYVWTSFSQEKKLLFSIHFVTKYVCMHLVWTSVVLLSFCCSPPDQTLWTMILKCYAICDTIELNCVWHIVRQL